MAAIINNQITCTKCMAQRLGFQLLTLPNSERLLRQTNICWPPSKFPCKANRGRCAYSTPYSISRHSHSCNKIKNRTDRTLNHCKMHSTCRHVSNSMHNTVLIRFASGRNIYNNRMDRHSICRNQLCLRSWGERNNFNFFLCPTKSKKLYKLLHPLRISFA